MYRCDQSDQEQTERMPIEFRHKEEQVPDTLLRLCLKYVARNLDTLCVETPDGYTLHDGLALPKEIGEPLIETYQNNGGEIFDCFAHLFEDVTKTNLRSVHVRNSGITDDGLDFLLRHELQDLELINCQNLTHRTYLNIFQRSANLRSLTIGPNVKLAPMHLKSTEQGSPVLTDDDAMAVDAKAPNLRQLVLRAVAESPPSYDKNNTFLADIIEKLPHLRMLDLSYCISVGSLRYLNQLTSLHTLIMFDVPHLQDHGAIINICALSTLV